MRNSIITLIKLLSPQGLRFTSELPYDESGVPLYIKNPNTIYVDNLQVEQEPLFVGLDGFNVANEINVVRIYFSTDAKNQKISIPQIVTQLRRLKDSIELPGATRREALVQTTYQGDLEITEIEYRLTRLN